MYEAAGITIVSLLGATLVLAGLQQFKRYNDSWWQISIFRRLAIVGVVSIGALLLASVLAAVAKKSDIASFILSLVVFLIIPVMISLGIRMYVRQSQYEGAMLIFAGVGLSTVIAIQLLAG